jgi:hypothetical protein
MHRNAFVVACSLVLASAGCAHNGAGEPDKQAAAAPVVPAGWTAPRPICKSRPSVPGGEAATVTVSFVVHDSGQVDTIELVTADAPPSLFEALKSWLSSCRFSPALDRDGKPTSVKVVEPFDFHHQGPKSFPGER